jgi:hypothetical protein
VPAAGLQVSSMASDEDVDGDGRADVVIGNRGGRPAANAEFAGRRLRLARPLRPIRDAGRSSSSSAWSTIGEPVPLVAGRDGVDGDLLSGPPR